MDRKQSRNQLPQQPPAFLNLVQPMLYSSLMAGSAFRCPVLARVLKVCQESLNAANNREQAARTALEELGPDSESEGSVNNTTAADIDNCESESEGGRGVGPPAAAAADSTGIG